MTDQPRLPLTKPTIPFGDVEADIRTILESGQLTGVQFLVNAVNQALAAPYMGARHQAPGPTVPPF